MSNTSRKPANPFTITPRYGSHDCVIVAADGHGFRVVVDLVPASRDDLWERVHHFALFADVGDAEAVAAAIRERCSIDLDAFTWIPSVCSPYACFQERPKAKRETTPRPSTGKNTRVVAFD